MTHTDTAPAWATRYTAIALAELPADITTATPAQVDEVIRTVQLDQQALRGQLDRAGDVLMRALGLRHHSERIGGPRSTERRDWWTRDGVEIDPTDEYAAARKLPAATPAAHYAGVDTIGEAFAAIDTLRLHIAAARQAEHDGDAEYHRRGEWTRFYRVNNSNGHVHATRACRETYATTQWTWPTQLSGGTAQTVVEAAGGLSCLTCFPEVRGTILENRDIDPTAFETPELRDARRAREQEKADKLAAKIAKGVTADGSALTVRMPRFYGNSFETLEIKTERAAQLRLVDALYDQGQARDGRGPEFDAPIGEIVDALAAKLGQTAEQVRAAAAPKVAKRIARGY